MLDDLWLYRAYAETRKSEFGVTKNLRNHLFVSLSTVSLSALTSHLSGYAGTMVCVCMCVFTWVTQVTATVRIFLAVMFALAQESRCSSLHRLTLSHLINSHHAPQENDVMREARPQHLDQTGTSVKFCQNVAAKPSKKHREPVPYWL